MQTWICAFCHQEFYDSRELISHIYNCHQEDMARPDARARIFISAIQLLSRETRKFPELPLSDRLGVIKISGEGK